MRKALNPKHYNPGSITKFRHIRAGSVSPLPRLSESPQKLLYMCTQYPLPLLSFVASLSFLMSRLPIPISFSLSLYLALLIAVPESTLNLNSHLWWKRRAPLSRRSTACKCTAFALDELPSRGVNWRQTRHHRAATARGCGDRALLTPMAS